MKQIYKLASVFMILMVTIGTVFAFSGMKVNQAQTIIGTKTNVAPLVSAASPISASGAWMNVQYPTNYLSFTTKGYVQYIPYKIEIYNNSMNPYKNIKIVFTTNVCNPDNICQPQYSQTKYTNAQGQTIFIEILPYLVNNIELTVRAYNSAGAVIANFRQRITNIGD